MSLLRRAGGKLLLPGDIVPSSGLAINYAHPLARELRAFCVPDGVGRLTDIAFPRRGGVCTAHGIGRRGPFIRTGNISDSLTRNCEFTSGSFSAACSFNIRSFGFDVIWGKGSWTNDSNNQGWEIQAPSGGTFCANIMTNNGGSFFRQSSTSTFTAGEHTVGFSTDGTTRKIFVNGTEEGSSTSLNTTAASTSQALAHDRAAGGVSDLYWGAVWGRALTPDEFRLLHFDPFCMLTYYHDGMTFLPTPPTFLASGMFSIFPP